MWTYNIIYYAHKKLQGANRGSWIALFSPLYVGQILHSSADTYVDEAVFIIKIYSSTGMQDFGPVLYHIKMNCDYIVFFNRSTCKNK